MANALMLLGCGSSGNGIPPTPTVWILHDAIWNDLGKWKDNAVWID